MSGAQPRKRASIWASTHFPGGRVGETEVTDFALAHQIVQSAHGFLDGGQRVPGVHPVEIDVIGPEAPQGLLAGRDDGFALGSAAFGSPGYRLVRNLVAITTRSRRLACRPR